VVYKILFSEDSLSELESLLDYIRADNPAAADRFGDALLNHVELLREFPRLGAPVPERPGLRKLIHSPVRVYYRLREPSGLIEILHFWHAARPGG
jgi:plasmid stabilization system protein ParE